MIFDIESKFPFNFKTVVTSHGWCQVKPFHWREEEEVLEYILRLSNGRVIKLEITGIPGGVKIDTSQLSKKEKTEVIDILLWMFGMELDLSPFYKAIRGKPQLAHVEKKNMGRILRSPTFFEDVVRTILTTNTLWSATIRMTANLVAQFGEGLPGEPERKAFPSPNRLAQTSEEKLRSETRLGYRAPYILELAKRIESSDLDMESYKTSALPTYDLRKELLKIKGIGPYAAANLLMILGRSDFLPIDSWALKVVSHEWFNGDAITPSQVQESFEKWGEWKGLVFWCWDWKLLHENNEN
ncbi:DNA-3-methyladenine glycosylase family protein [Chloroflexota bacterium]